MAPREATGETAAIWLRRGNESAVAYSAFVIYREQAPPRSIRKVARVLGRGQRTLEEWSSKYKWVERAAAYTDHLDQLMLAANEEDIVRRRRETNERVYELARAAAAGLRALSGVYGLTRGSSSSLRSTRTRSAAATSSASSSRARRWSRLALGLPADVDRRDHGQPQGPREILRGFFGVAEKRMPRRGLRGVRAGLPRAHHRSSSGTSQLPQEARPEPAGLVVYTCRRCRDSPFRRLCFTLASDVCVEQVGSLGLVAGQQVAVAVERDRDRRMTHVGADGLRADAGGDEKARVRVPGFVERDRRQSGCMPRLLSSYLEGAVVEGPSLRCDRREVPYLCPAAAWCAAR